MDQTSFNTNALHVMQNLVASQVAAALITAAGRPHSVEEAVKLMQDVRYSLFPQRQDGHYVAWEKSKTTKARHT